MSQTVLVTGATGFIGRHLLQRLRGSQDARIVVLVRRPDDAPAPGIMQVVCALDQVKRHTWNDHGINRIDTVFHLAAYTPKSPDRANDVEAICRDNIDGTRALLESLPSAPERFVFASTLDVYAPPGDGEIIDERSRLGPSGLYGASKLFCEQLVRAVALQQGFRAIVLRYGHIFGPGEEGYRKLIPQMIRTLLAGERPKLYGNGGAERDYLYVSDAVEATVRAAATDAAGQQPINIVRGQSRPIREIAGSLARLTGFTEQSEFQRNLPDGLSLRFDASRMRSVLGEWPLMSLEDGLAREVSYFRSLG